MDNTELITKMISCSLIEMSVKRDKTETIQAPMAKKKRINPGTTNSRRNNMNPITNHTTGVDRNDSIFNFQGFGNAKVPNIELIK